MSLATQFAGAIACAQFHELNDLAHKLWKAHAAGHLDDGQAQELAEQIEARKPKRSIDAVTSLSEPLVTNQIEVHPFLDQDKVLATCRRHGLKPVRLPKPKPQRSPDKQASIERRRRLARQSPVPPELVDQFTQGEHAALTVVCGEIQRCGLCAWCLAKIAAIAGVCRDVVRNAMRKARDLGLLHREERRRRGQKSLTNIVRVLRRSWGRWLKWIGVKKFGTTTDKDSKSGAAEPGESSGGTFSGNPRWSGGA